MAALRALRRIGPRASSMSGPGPATIRPPASPFTASIPARSTLPRASPPRQFHPHQLPIQTQAVQRAYSVLRFFRLFIEQEAVAAGVVGLVVDDLNVEDVAEGLEHIREVCLRGLRGQIGEQWLSRQLGGTLAAQEFVLATLLQTAFFQRLHDCGVVRVAVQSVFWQSLQCTLQYFHSQRRPAQVGDQRTRHSPMSRQSGSED